MEAGKNIETTSSCSGEIPAETKLSVDSG